MPDERTRLVTAAAASLRRLRESDRLPVAEELVVLVVAPVAAADAAEVGDELDHSDPPDLLKPKLRSSRSRSGAPCP